MKSCSMLLLNNVKNKKQCESLGEKIIIVSKKMNTKNTLSNLFGKGTRRSFEVSELVAFTDPSKRPAIKYLIILGSVKSTSESSVSP